MESHFPARKSSAKQNRIPSASLIKREFEISSPDLISRIKPTAIEIEKEHLFNENLKLKLLTNSYKEETLRLKGRLRQHVGELNLKDSMIKQLTANVEKPGYKNMHYISHLSLTLRETEANLADVLEELENLKKKKQNPINQQLSNDLIESKEYSNALQRKLEELQKEKIELLTDNQKLECNVKNLNEKYNLEKQNRVKVAELESEIFIMKKEMENLKNQLSLAKKEAEISVTHYNELVNEVEKLKKIIDNMESNKNKILELKSENERKMIEYLNINEKLNKEIDNLKNHISILESEKKQNLDEILSQQEKLQKMNNEKNILNEKFLKVQESQEDLIEENRKILRDLQIDIYPGLPEVLLHFLFSMQIAKIPKSKLISVFNISHGSMLSRDDFECLFANPPFYFILKHPEALKNIVQIFFKINNKLSFEEVIDIINEIFPDWAIYNKKDEEKMDLQLVRILAIHYSNLQYNFKQYDPSNLGNINFREFNTALLKEGVMLDISTQKYLLLKSYMLTDELLKIPYIVFSTELANHFKNLDKEDIKLIARAHISNIAKISIELNQDIKKILVAKDSKISTKNFLDGLKKLDIVVELSIVEVIFMYLNDHRQENTVKWKALKKVLKEYGYKYKNLNMSNESSSGSSGNKIEQSFTKKIQPMLLEPLFETKLLDDQLKIVSENLSSSSSYIKKDKKSKNMESNSSKSNSSIAKMISKSSLRKKSSSSPKSSVKSSKNEESNDHKADLIDSDPSIHESFESMRGKSFNSKKTINKENNFKVNSSSDSGSKKRIEANQGKLNKSPSSSYSSNSRKGLDQEKNSLLENIDGKVNTVIEEEEKKTYSHLLISKKSSSSSDNYSKQMHSPKEKSLSLDSRKNFDSDRKNKHTDKVNNESSRKFKQSKQNKESKNSSPDPSFSSDKKNKLKLEKSKESIVNESDSSIKEKNSSSNKPGKKKLTDKNHDIPTKEHKKRESKISSKKSLSKSDESSSEDSSRSYTSNSINGTGSSFTGSSYTGSSISHSSHIDSSSSQSSSPNSSKIIKRKDKIKK